MVKFARVPHEEFVKAVFTEALASIQVQSY